MPVVNLTCLVDDDEIFVYAMKKLIKIKQLSDSVISFNKVSDAIDYLKANGKKADELPDVLFLDVNLPIQDGWDFIKEYEKIKSLLAKEPRICMLSSSVNTNDQQKAKSLPAVFNFYEKPLQQEDFQDAFQF